jgi:hypothetical protein
MLSRKQNGSKRTRERDEWVRRRPTSEEQNSVKRGTLLTGHSSAGNVALNTNSRSKGTPPNWTHGRNAINHE